jgi:uncharacterized protein (DUF736 family)
MIALEMSDRNIGNFNAEKDGLTCALRTPAANVKVEQVPDDRGDSEYGPDFHVPAAGRNIRAEAKKVCWAQRPYMSVTLDDPLFPTTVYACLIDGEDVTHSPIGLAASQRGRTSRRCAPHFPQVLMKPSSARELVREITVVHFGMGRETLSPNVKQTYFPWSRI